MAEAETNPVLEIIDHNKPVEENKKYPGDLLQFNQTGWRAYYHCHPAARTGNHCFQCEHGHFHIFVRTQVNPEAWSHVVALAMDNMGQPLGWFTVNHWVTGEQWQSAESLITLLNTIPYANQQSLIERWILSLVALSVEEIAVILSERDKVIERHQDKSEDKNIKQDKALYLLSEAAINLHELLNLNNG